MSYFKLQISMPINGGKIEGALHKRDGVTHNELDLAVWVHKRCFLLLKVL